MMTAAEHYEMAEGLLIAARQAEKQHNDALEASCLQYAQLHANLALAQLYCIPQRFIAGTGPGGGAAS